MNSIKWTLWSMALISSLAFGQAPAGRTSGQLLYLPIYSHIWHGEVDGNGQPTKTLVSVSVSIRNTDPAKPIRITSAQYFDTDGKRLREYLPAAKTIAPMGTYELFIPRSDDSGGSGANFLIAWKSDVSVNAPIVEAIHANLPAGRSIAFTTSARPLSVDY
ncbi:MAG: DUF3124 domain-containing protein [Betaproteobacteria bacterium]